MFDPWPGVHALMVYNGELIAGGEFTTAGGTEANCIARWDGTTWSPLDSGMNGEVFALTVYDGELIAGGRFTPPVVRRPTISLAGTARAGRC